MRIVVAILASVVMIAYMAYRVFTTLMIMPLAVPIFSGGAMFFCFLLLLATASTVLSFTRRKGMAALLASIVGLLGLGFWCFVIHYVRQDFIWFVVPEACFSVAGIGKWLAFKTPARDVPTLTA